MCVHPCVGEGEFHIMKRKCCAGENISSGVRSGLQSWLRYFVDVQLGLIMILTCPNKIAEVKWELCEREHR